MPYDPAIHHRQRIRLKGHNYAGGGIYFVRFVSVAGIRPRKRKPEAAGSSCLTHCS